MPGRGQIEFGHRRIGCIGEAMGSREHASWIETRVSRSDEHEALEAPGVIELEGIGKRMTSSGVQERRVSERGRMMQRHGAVSIDRKDDAEGVPSGFVGDLNDTTRRYRRAVGQGFDDLTSALGHEQPWHQARRGCGHRGGSRGFEARVRSGDARDPVARERPHRESTDEGREGPRAGESGRFHRTGGARPGRLRVGRFHHAPLQPRGMVEVSPPSPKFFFAGSVTPTRDAGVV